MEVQTVLLKWAVIFSPVYTHKNRKRRIKHPLHQQHPQSQQFLPFPHRLIVDTIIAVFGFRDDVRDRTACSGTNRLLIEKNVIFFQIIIDENVHVCYNKFIKL